MNINHTYVRTSKLRPSHMLLTLIIVPPRLIIQHLIRLPRRRRPPLFQLISRAHWLHYSLLVIQKHQVLVLCLFDPVYPVLFCCRFRQQQLPAVLKVIVRVWWWSHWFLTDALRHLFVLSHSSWRKGHVFYGFFFVLLFVNFCLLQLLYFSLELRIGPPEKVILLFWLFQVFLAFFELFFESLKLNKKLFQFFIVKLVKLMHFKFNDFFA